MWRQRASLEEAAATRVLGELGRNGVGGRLRSGYLHRRLAWETCGEVVFEDLWPDRAGEAEPAPRMISLTRMQALINAWRIRRGFSFDRPCLPRGRCEQGSRKVQWHDYEWGRAGAKAIHCCSRQSHRNEKCAQRRFVRDTRSSCNSCSGSRLSGNRELLNFTCG